MWQACPRRCDPGVSSVPPGTAGARRLRCLLGGQSRAARVGRVPEPRRVTRPHPCPPAGKSRPEIPEIRVGDFERGERISEVAWPSGTGRDDRDSPAFRTGRDLQAPLLGGAGTPGFVRCDAPSGQCQLPGAVCVGGAVAVGVPAALRQGRGRVRRVRAGFPKHAPPRGDGAHLVAESPKNGEAPLPAGSAARTRPLPPWVRAVARAHRGGCGRRGGSRRAPGAVRQPYRSPVREPHDPALAACSPGQQ